MKTSSYYIFKGDGRVSISRSQPKGFNLPAYRPLAPGPWFNSVSEEEYRRRYFEQLSKLDARKVVADLEKLAEGAEPVLLCYEKLKTPGEYCHRRMVAEWLKAELGMDVAEIGSFYQEKPKPTLIQDPLF